MGMKEQWNKIRENWLIVVVVIVAFAVMNMGGMSSNSYKSIDYGLGASYVGYADESYRGSSGNYWPPSYDTDFAPEVKDRKITKTASMSSEVKNGEFESASQQLKNIITSSDSFLLDENVNKQGSGSQEIYHGQYSIKVETSKYESLVAQLKGIGKITSFHENANDVTGQYTNAQINLEVEKARLVRYQKMYADATLVSDQITLSDRMFDQERTIKYLEQNIANIDQRIEYTTVTFSLSEKQSNFANIAVVEFWTLVRSLVSSFNNLITLVFVIIPWGVALLLVVGVWKLVKRKKKQPSSKK